MRSPPAREWRARFRRARRKHHERPLSDLLSDLYALLWLVLVYGGALVSSVRRHATLSSTGISPEALWITVGIALVGTGLAWRTLAALGPLMATPAEQSWAVSTPLDRRGWLLPRLTSVLLVAGVVAAVLAAAASMGLHASRLGWTALGGGLLGIALAGASVYVQGRSSTLHRGGGDIQWPGRAGAWLIAAGFLAASAVVISHQAGRSLSVPGLPSPLFLAAAGAPLACLAVVASVRALADIDLSALNAGTQLAEATVTATVAFDVSVLSGILEVRRWRRVGRVSSRPFAWGRLGRTWILLQAEFRRQLRRPALLGAWVVLAVAQYAMAFMAPSVAPVTHLIFAYVAAGRLASGLRHLSRSPGLRRALGGDDLQVRLAHMVIPTVGVVLWWLATWPVGGSSHVSLDLLLTAGVAAATYRAATRPPLSYGGVVMETPFGLFPLELFVGMARGPDLLGAMIVLQWIAMQ